MLNYIWTALIALSLGFALWGDFSDLSSDRYRNGAGLPVVLKAREVAAAGVVGQPVEVVIEPVIFRGFYGVTGEPAASYAGVLLEGEGKRVVRFGKG